jgi:hypothetical protein
LKVFCEQCFIVLPISVDSWRITIGLLYYQNPQYRKRQTQGLSKRQAGQESNNLPEKGTSHLINRNKRTALITSQTITWKESSDLPFFVLVECD